MSLNHLVTYTYSLKIDGKVIGLTDPRRQRIMSIECNLRRQGLSSLKITFSDPDLQWRNFFTVPRTIIVEFSGYNYDGSVLDYFEGCVAQISPATQGNLYDLEVTCLSIMPKMTNPVSTARVFKKMSRKQIIDKFASENKARVQYYTTSDLNVVLEEETLSVNTTPTDFIGDLLTQIGYVFNTITITEWIVIPMYSTHTKAGGGTYSNLRGDTTLLDFQPSFSPYSFPDSSTDGTNSPSTKSSVDPTTKNTNTSSNKDKPSNKPKGSTKPNSGSKSSSPSQMYYDPKTGKWTKA